MSTRSTYKHRESRIFQIRRARSFESIFSNTQTEVISLSSVETTSSLNRKYTVKDIPDKTKKVKKVNVILAYTLPT